MRPQPPEPPRGGGCLTLGIFGLVLAVLGLLSGLPWLLGPVIGVAGVLLSSRLRASTRLRSELALLPGLAAMATLLFASPIAPSTELFGGLASLAFLLWLADDPARAPGGGRRAVPTLGLAGLAFGLAWSITLPFGPAAPDIGLASGLLVAALVLVGLALWRASVTPWAATA